MVLNAFEVSKTREGCELLIGDLILIAHAPRLDKGAVKAALTVMKSGAIVTTDTVNLTSSRSRAGFRNSLQARQLELEDPALLALESACREWLAKGRVAIGQGRNSATNASDAEPVLAAADPLVLVRQAFLDAGYGGDLKPALITYLATTSRLLAMRRGAMPVHLLLLGPPSAGKSYTLGTVLTLLPESAVHVIDAGSPRVLIYDSAELQHRVVIFGEADSLPAGEDNPAASAIRNLLQDHYLHYKVTVRDDASGGYVVQDVVKEGPTVLITTATRPLGDQLSTRLFSLEVPDGARQVQAALIAQAKLERNETPVRREVSLIAFQQVLQDGAPWDVVVPYAGELATAIARSATAPRVLRDFQRLLSLIKSVTILRHQHRHRDAGGRLVAEAEDYQAVFDLVAEMYEATVSGVTEKLRQVVAAVGDAVVASEQNVSYSLIAKTLNLRRDAVFRAAQPAIRNGWLQNPVPKGARANLSLGDPLPERSGLPSPQVVCCNVAPHTDGSPLLDEEPSCCSQCLAFIPNGTELCEECQQNSAERDFASTVAFPEKVYDASTQALLSAAFANGAEPLVPSYHEPQMRGTSRHE